MMNFFGRVSDKVTPPTLPRAPIAPAAPRPSGNGGRVRPGSHRSVGSGSRFSTSSQSSPEPDADAGEDQCAAYSGDEALLDSGWGVSEVVAGTATDSTQVDGALAAAETRIRALEKQLQNEQRLRKDAEDSLAHVRSKMNTPVQTARTGPCRSRDPDDTDTLMDVGVQTQAQPLPGRQEIEREIEKAVETLQKQNDALEIENQMLQAALEDKDTEIQTLRSDNKVLWGEQDAIRAAKDDFKDLQVQLAAHIKAGNLITKRPSSARTNIGPGHEGIHEITDPFGHLFNTADESEVGMEKKSVIESTSMSSAQSQEYSSNETFVASSPQSSARQDRGESDSALSNFMGIFQGKIQDDDAGPIFDSTEYAVDSKFNEPSEPSIGLDTNLKSSVQQGEDNDEVENNRPTADFSTSIPERPRTAERSNRSYAEYRRSVGDYRKGIAALEAKLRPTILDKGAAENARTRTHNKTASSREPMRVVHSHEDVTG